jgi:flagellar biosynthesis protein FliQ
LGVIVPASGCCFATGWVLSIMGLPSSGGLGVDEVSVVGVGVGVGWVCSGVTRAFAVVVPKIIAAIIATVISGVFMFAFLLNLFYRKNWLKKFLKNFDILVFSS